MFHLEPISSEGTVMAAFMCKTAAVLRHARNLLQPMPIRPSATCHARVHLRGSQHNF